MVFDMIGYHHDVQQFLHNFFLRIVFALTSYRNTDASNVVTFKMPLTKSTNILSKRVKLIPLKTSFIYEYNDIFL
jgi:hypothetical protein